MVRISYFEFPATIQRFNKKKKNSRFIELAFFGSVNGTKIQGFFLCTLVYQIIMQDGINCRLENFPKLIKCAGWNKAVQDGI